MEDDFQETPGNGFDDNAEAQDEDFAGDADLPSAAAQVILTPGSVVSAPESFLRGHGTYTQGDTLIASVAGVVQRVNKLTTVHPPKARFAGSVGDVVVGRVTEVGNKRWKVDINAKQDGVLLLGSINLPGGAQRRRTLEDQLQMRSLFAENDVISGEVASFYKDGMVALQTRSLKYGKLENGRLIVVPSSLVKRVKHHFCSLAFGVDLVLGVNGYIWVTASKQQMTSVEDEAERNRLTEEMERELAHHATRVFGPKERDRIARACNALLVLANGMYTITPAIIEAMCLASTQLSMRADEMLHPAQAARLVKMCVAGAAE